MKRLLLISMILPVLANAQSYSGLIGVTYQNQTELSALKNCVQLAAKVDLDRYICRVYFDTNKGKHVIVVEKENRAGDENTFTILDITEFGSINIKQHLFVGGAQGKHENTHRFVIAVDCCYVINKAEDWPASSFRMYKAWAINKSTNKIEKLKARKVFREAESFMW